VVIGDEIEGHFNYRFPLKLVNSQIWGALNSPAKAVLPVLGVHANQDWVCWPGRKKIAELAGYYHLEDIDEGLKDLEEKGLILRGKKGRHNFYILRGLAVRIRGSYFPISKFGIYKGYWAKLTASEKGLYPVLGVKARIKDPDVYCPAFARGSIARDKRGYREWAGISRRSFERACLGLGEKSLIEFEGDPYDSYYIYLISY